MKQIQELLKQERLKQNYSLDELSKKTKIAVNHLCDLEEGRWDSFSSYAYIQGMVKKYARALDMDILKINAFLKRDIQEQKPHFIRKTHYHEKAQYIPSSWYVGFVVVLFIMLFVFQLLFFWQKPLLALEAIPKSISVDNPLVIKGKTETGALVYLNEERIYQNEAGVFKQELYLKKGKRYITIKVVGTNGRTSEQTIVVEIR